MTGGGMNVGQVKKQLKILAKSRDQYIMYIGQLAYEDYRNDRLPNQSLQEPCATLRDIYEQMGLWEEQLEVLHSVRKARVGRICPYCRAPMLDGAAFCNSCGKPVPPAAMPEEEEAGSGESKAAVLTCPACASPALENSSYCPACGWRLVEERDGDQEKACRRQTQGEIEE